nr:MAG TPA: hypothetical protein [Caudoviricetes sp.]
MCYNIYVIKRGANLVKNVEKRLKLWKTPKRKARP